MVGREPQAAYLGGQGSPNTDHHLLLVMVHRHVEGRFVHLGGGRLVSLSSPGLGPDSAGALSTRLPGQGVSPAATGPQPPPKPAPSRPGSSRPAQVTAHAAPCRRRPERRLPSPGPHCFLPDSFSQRLRLGSPNPGCGVGVHSLAPEGRGAKAHLCAAQPGEAAARPSPRPSPRRGRRCRRCPRPSGSRPGSGAGWRWRCSRSSCLPRW